MIDFEGIHSTIKDSIESDGFKYVPLNNWINLQRDIIPASWKGTGFSIRFELDSDVESESHYAGILGLNLEFALDAVNDNYLTQIDNMVSAVRNIFTVLEAAGYSMISVSDNWFNFVSENILDALIFTFDQIRIMIKIS